MTHPNLSVNSCIIAFAEGRRATRAEVEASIYSGLPILEGQAAEEGPAAVAALRRMTTEAMRYLPA